jgi:hypothetical protein
MTASADWTVQGPERGREIHETAPVSPRDRKYPRRRTTGDRRRRGRGGPADTSDAAPEPAPAPDEAPRDGEPPAPDGGEHVIDTLA